jgi:hypothetical protein
VSYRPILKPVVIVAAILACSVPPPAAAEDVTGGHLVEFCESDSASDLALCHGFFRGLSDTHSIYAAMGKGLHLYCLPRGVTQEQFERVAFRWMEANPERLQRPAAVLIVQALHERYPCTADGEAAADAEQAEAPLTDPGAGEPPSSSDGG